MSAYDVTKVQEVRIIDWSDHSILFVSLSHLRPPWGSTLLPAYDLHHSTHIHLFTTALHHIITRWSRWYFLPVHSVRMFWEMLHLSFSTHDQSISTSSTSRFGLLDFKFIEDEASTDVISIAVMEGPWLLSNPCGYFPALWHITHYNSGS